MLRKNRYTTIAYFLTILFCTASILFPQDSTKTYELKEITVSGIEFINPKPIVELKRELIKKADAKSVADLAKFFPALKLQVNSRGESQIFLRGYGVRQLALFFDGVPLPVAWDNRIDLSLVPTNALGSVVISNGTPSVLFGANTLGGVIAITSVTPDTADELRNFSYFYGTNNSHDIKFNYSGTAGKMSYLFSLGYEKSDEYSLPHSVKEYYNNSSFRLNSDYKRFNGFGKVLFKFSGVSQTSMSISLIDADKGVPPEIEVGKPRFWRYPLWRKLTFILNGKHDLFDSLQKLEYALSLTGFRMNIEQYKDEFYSILEDKEDNKDFSVYGRTAYSNYLTNSSTLKIALSGLNAFHKESFLSDPVEKIYSQYVFSIGAEYEYHTSKYTFLTGVSMDNQFTPLTGDKPKRDGELKLNFETELTHFFSDNFSAQLGIGKKSRFPTLRELYSGALGRFVPNPDLKSEDVYTIETNWKMGSDLYSINASVFYSLLTNGIQRISLPEKQFKRVNKSKIRTWGGEVSSRFHLKNNLDLKLNISYLNSFAENESGSFTDTLEYKPCFIAGMQMTYMPLADLNINFEANFVGEEFGLKEGSEYFQKLPSYAIVNFRISYYFELFERTGLEMFIRVNNFFDKLYYTQWGLPEKGREILFGLKFNY